MEICAYFFLKVSQCYYREGGLVILDQKIKEKDNLFSPVQSTSFELKNNVTFDVNLKSQKSESSIKQQLDK